MAEAPLSLSSFKDQFDDQLTCSVCLDQYTNPKTLPCHHSFCLECIRVYSTTASKNKGKIQSKCTLLKKHNPLKFSFQDSKYYITCPTCRVDHLIPQGGVANFPK